MARHLNSFCFDCVQRRKAPWLNVEEAAAHKNASRVVERLFLGGNTYSTSVRRNIHPSPKKEHCKTIEQHSNLLASPRKACTSLPSHPSPHSPSFKGEATNNLQPWATKLTASQGHNQGTPPRIAVAHPTALHRQKTYSRVLPRELETQTAPERRSQGEMTCQSHLRAKATEPRRPASPSTRCRWYALTLFQDFPRLLPMQQLGFSNE